MMEDNILDLPKLTGMILSTEDFIFSTLFKEKCATKGELVNFIHGYAYGDISRNISRMEEKGYVNRRTSENHDYFYLTASGVYEMEYRLNYENFSSIHRMLLIRGYALENVQRFLRNRFYNYYLSGEFDIKTLVDEYVAWCKSNELDPRNPLVRKLTTGNNVKNMTK